MGAAVALPWSVPFPAHAGVLVRRAVPQDLVELAALKRRAERRCYAHLGTAEALSVRLHRRATAWWLLGRLSAGDLLLLAHRDGRAVGLGAASLTEDGRGVSRVHLHSGYAEAPGHGVGRALLAARLEAADALGVATVTASAFVGDVTSERRLRELGLAQVCEPTPSLTFPGVPLSHWAGSVHTALQVLHHRHLDLEEA